MPKDMAIYNAKITYIFFKSAHNNTESNKPVKIIRPPIVGVPIFLTICSDGPSFLIGLVISLIAKYLINGFPINSTIINEVNTATPVRNVIYLNTFKKEKMSTKFKRKL